MDIRELLRQAYDKGFIDAMDGKFTTDDFEKWISSMSLQLWLIDGIISEKGAHD